MKPTLRAITEHRHRHPSGVRELAPRRLRAGRKAPVMPTCEGQDQREAAGSNSLITPDLALLRAQGAGGPLDCASYSCECGFVFAASVSTTVSCPHCGTPQAW
jgi:hypothetical protein